MKTRRMASKVAHAIAGSLGLSYPAARMICCRRHGTPWSNGARPDVVPFPAINHAIFATETSEMASDRGKPAAGRTSLCGAEMRRLDRSDASRPEPPSRRLFPWLNNQVRKGVFRGCSTSSAARSKRYWGQKRLSCKNRTRWPLRKVKNQPFSATQTNELALDTG